MSVEPRKIELWSAKERAIEGLGENKAFIEASIGPNFDSFLLAVIVYFKHHLKHIHFHQESTWLSVQFESHVKMIANGAFAQENKDTGLQESFSDLAKKYALWKLRINSQFNSRDQNALYSGLVTFLVLVLKQIFTAKYDSSLIDSEVQRLFDTKLKKSGNSRTVYDTTSPLISSMYPNTKERIAAYGRVKMEIKKNIASSMNQAEIESFDYDAIEIVAGYARSKKHYELKKSGINHKLMKKHSEGFANFLQHL